MNVVDRTLLNRGYCLEMDGQLGPALADYADACERGHDMACENQALLQGQGIKAERLADQAPPPKLRRREVTAGGTVMGSASAGGSASGTAGGATVSHSARGTVTSGGAAVGKEDL